MPGVAALTRGAAHIPQVFLQQPAARSLTVLVSVAVAVVISQLSKHVALRLDHFLLQFLQVRNMATATQSETCGI